MEAIEAEVDEDEVQHMSLEDVEMMELPRDLCQELSENAENRGLPTDLYVIPDRMASSRVRRWTQGLG
jgi:hypothetical protein